MVLLPEEHRFLFTGIETFLLYNCIFNTAWKTHAAGKLMFLLECLQQDYCTPECLQCFLTDNSTEFMSSEYTPQFDAICEKCNRAPELSLYNIEDIQKM